MTDGPMILGNVAEALAWMVESQVATLEWAAMLKKTSKHDLRRHEFIARCGLANCKKFVTPDEARRVGAHRVEDYLWGKRDELGRKPEDTR